MGSQPVERWVKVEPGERGSIKRERVGYSDCAGFLALLRSSRRAGHPLSTFTQRPPGCSVKRSDASSVENARTGTSLFHITQPRRSQAMARTSCGSSREGVPLLLTSTTLCLRWVCLRRSIHSPTIREVTHPRREDPPRPRPLATGLFNNRLGLDRLSPGCLATASTPPVRNPV